MKKHEFLNTMSRSFHKMSFGVKKHSPEILVAAGVVGVVTSAVLACRATTKLNDVLNDSKDQIDKIHGYVEEHGFTEKYTEEDSKKDLTIVHTQTAVKVVKLYAPAVIIGVASLGCILSSHKILNKRNAAIAAAYTAIDKSFKEYRGRVVDRFGADLDKELRYNIKAQEIEETVTDEKGKEKTVTNTVNAMDASDISDYARFFDVGNENWTKDPEFNLMFLKHQQSQANDILKAKGHLFLNDVYEMIGIPKSQAGQAVGWIYDEKCPIGDNYVDFGIYNDSEANRLFVNGHERSILLDFNVDGVIWDKL